MATVNYETETLEQDVEHEGSKSPVKSYDWDEIDEIDVDDPFEFSNVEEARRAHTFLHWGWDDRALDGWHYEEIIAEHARIVSYFIDQGERHVLWDSLDTTLPDDLKEYSKKPDSDLTFIRTIDTNTAEKLRAAGVDNHLKLRKADLDELSEETGLDVSYLEYIQERAEQL
jgi:hypothetical protein